MWDRGFSYFCFLPVGWCQPGFLLVYPSLCKISQHQSARRQKYRHYIPQRHVRAFPFQCHCTPGFEMQNRDLQAMKMKRRNKWHFIHILSYAYLITALINTSALNQTNHLKHLFLKFPLHVVYFSHFIRTHAPLELSIIQVSHM